LKVLAVDPPHFKKNFSNSVSCLGASASAPARTRNISINKYSKNDILLFVVYVYSNKSTLMHFSVLFRVVSEFIKNNILLIKRLGKAIIKVKFADVANCLISVFDKNNLQAFIPSFKHLRIRIIKDVDQSIALNSLREKSNLNCQST